jgi:hypothetical protein
LPVSGQVACGYPAQPPGPAASRGPRRLPILRRGLAEGTIRSGWVSADGRIPGGWISAEEPILSGRVSFEKPIPGGWRSAEGADSGRPARPAGRA